MAPTTLENAFSKDSQSPAIVIPSNPSITVSYETLATDVKAFQQKLATLGVSPQDAVSIALPNSYEFIVSFIAASWQRAIAAPLNPAYKQSEFEFYIDDLSSAIALVPKGAFAQDAAAVRAARKYRAAIAECYYNGKEVVLDVKETGKLAGKTAKVETAQPDDVALVGKKLQQLTGVVDVPGPELGSNLLSLGKSLKDDTLRTRSSSQQQWTEFLHLLNVVSVLAAL